MNIKLAIVDDDQRLAKVLKHELLEYGEIGSIDLFAGGKRCVEYLQDLSPSLLPNVVLMDINMQEKEDGIAITQQLHDQFPTIKVIMFTIAEDDEHIFEAFKAGAIGYLLKNEKPSFILKAILDVHSGGALMSPGVALKTIRFLVPENQQKVIEPLQDFHLTEREVDVLRFIAKGHTYHMIADTLFISVETVKKHTQNIFKKLRVRNKIEAINKTRQLL